MEDNPEGIQNQSPLGIMELSDQLIERRVNGFHIGAAAAVVQKAAVPHNRGEFNLVGMQEAGIGVLMR